LEKNKSHDSAASIIKTQAGDRKCAIYVEPGKDLTWMAVASPQAPSHASIMLCFEQSYPVQLNYRRIDIDGSSMMTAISCNSRARLEEALNWIGACRFPLHSLWDFDIERFEDSSLFDLFDSCLSKRAEMDRESMMGLEDGITEITREQAAQILSYMDSPSKRYLSQSGFDFLNKSGKYYYAAENRFIGLDYSYDYEGYVEEFSSLGECLAWLQNLFESSDVQEWRLRQRRLRAEIIKAGKTTPQHGPDKSAPLTGAKKTTLRAFLSYFDFDYVVYTNDNKQEASWRKTQIANGDLFEDMENARLLGLIDKQGGDLGHIEGDRFPLENDLVERIIDRMDIYVNDYVISEFEQALKERKFNTSKYNLHEMFLLCKGLGVGDEEVCYDLAALILAPEYIIVPELLLEHGIDSYDDHPKKPDLISLLMDNGLDEDDADAVADAIIDLMDGKEESA